MAAMNTVGGGPVGEMPMMNNGIPGGSRPNDYKTLLNTYIYDYFLKNELYDCARVFMQSDAPLTLTKASPGMRRDADGNPLNNGVDENSMETEIKEEADSKRPDDLPAPKITQDLSQNCFLQDWWCLFWDVFAANRKKNKPGEGGGAAVQYLQYTQQQRLRQEQSQQFLRQMNPAAMMPNQYMIRLQNGMEIPQNQLPRKAMQNSRNATPQQMQLAKSQQFLQQQMQRGNSNMGMNGEQRPQSPSSAENAPSPSKRPRLENGPFQGQPVGPAGRGQPQGMPGQPMMTGPQAEIAAQAHHMILQNGINPNQFSPQTLNTLQQQHPDMQQKALQVFSENGGQPRGGMNNGGLPKGMPNPGGVPNQGSPMMPQGSDGQAMINIGAYYEGNSGPPVRMNGPGQTGGNALQDYQLQLMLLEQQNKKRLLLARAEQDGFRPENAVHVQQGLQGMSPQGPRSGPSPNPQEQMNRRGSPKMNQVGMPGSPLPDGSMPKGRGSPTAMGLHPGQVPHAMAPGLMQEVTEMKPTMVGGPPNGAMMRPPSSHPTAFNGQPLNAHHLEALTRAQRMQQGQNWQQAHQAQQAQQQQNQQVQQVHQGPNQMMQQPHQGQPPQPIGTPQPRNAMPPPQAPPTTNGNGRTQPSSPQQNAAPPTPQQTNKPNPKAKKESKGAGKRPIKKVAGNVNAGVTPSSEPEPPPTPTPPTPITPMHSNSFSAQQGKQNPGQMVGNSQAPTSAPIPAPPMPQPPPDATQVGSFPTTDNQDGGLMSLDFASLDNPDVFNAIDFEAFLRTDDADSSGLGGFDMGTSTGYNDPNPLEAGAGDV